MKILVNNEIKEISLIDPKTGIDYLADILGSYNAETGYDDEKALVTMQEETFEWWAELIPKHEAAEHALYEYRKELDDEDQRELDDLLNTSIAVDLEDQHAVIMDVIEEHKASKK